MEVSTSKRYSAKFKTQSGDVCSIEGGAYDFTIAYDMERAVCWHGRIRTEDLRKLGEAITAVLAELDAD